MDLNTTVGISPSRYIVYNLYHPKLFKGTKCKFHNLIVSTEDSGKHFICVWYSVVHHKHSVIVALACEDK